MAQLINVRLSRVDAQPWGLRLQGGKDFGTPLLIQKVNMGSIADQVGLIAGDSVIKVNSVDVYNLRHKDAQDIIVRSGNSFDITVQRGGSTWRPSVTPTGALPSPTPTYSTNQINTVTRTSLAHKQQEIQHIGSGYNNAARPFNAQNGEPVKSIVNKQYNTPVGIYSEESIAETLSAQAEVLAGGVLGVNFKKNEKVYNSAGSEVLKALQESENDPVEPDDYMTNRVITPVAKHVSAPIDRPAPPPTAGLPAGQNICTECERLIVGVFVRIKDKNLHADCFKCATCGTSLKNQGYFHLNNKLYCDIHAKMAAMNNPPPGTEGYRPVPIQPNTKLSANTISAALNAHHINSQNGISLNNNHDFLLPTHSRTSSSASSVGSSYVSSTDSNKASPNKTSPIHSRQGSNSLQTGYNNNYKHNIEENDKNIINSSYHNSTLPHYQMKLNAQIKEYYNEKNKNAIVQSTDDIDNHNCVQVDHNNGTTVDDMNGVESIYGTIRPHTKKKPYDEFNYKTLSGSVIRSVHPPGNGKSVNYKVNSNLAGPKPFAYGSGPVSAGPKSPSTYPPPSGAPSWSQPKPNYGAPIQNYSTPPQNYSAPAPNNYSNYGSNTLPRSVGHTAPVPPPLPSTPPPFIIKESKDVQDGYKTGHATELLEQSVKNLKVSDKDDFRSHAGKIISFMLESRLNDKGLPVEPLSTSLDNISMKKVTDLSEEPPILSKLLQAPVAISDLTNNECLSEEDQLGNIAYTLPEKLPPLPGKDYSNGTAMIIALPSNQDQSPPHSPPPPPPPPHQEIPNSIYTEKINNIVNGFPPKSSPIKNDTDNQQNGKNSVIFRNKDSKSELTTHARDRRSYIEKDQQINNNSVLSSHTTDIASELNDGKHPLCSCCNTKIMRGPFITALGRIWCPDHFVCVTANCRRPLQDIGFVEEKGNLYCEYCFEKYLAPPCDKCGAKIKGDCLNAIGKHFHPECFTCAYCGKLFGNSPFFLEDGQAYCENDWNELFTTKCFACGFPVEAGDRWVEALSHNYHSQCFNCTMCKKNLEGQSFFAKGGRPFCKNHAR